jgi:hypothetical protein
MKVTIHGPKGRPGGKKKATKKHGAKKAAKKK